MFVGYGFILSNQLRREPHGLLLNLTMRQLGQILIQPLKISLLKHRESGMLLGAKTQEAFFVNCDKTTMNQNDIDNRENKRAYRSCTGKGSRIHYI